MEFIGYAIFDSKDIPMQNTIRRGRKQCIDSFIEYAPFANWSIAKVVGRYTCKKVTINLTIK